MADSKLNLYNTLSRKKEIFAPLENNLVKMYSCGPTVYNFAHIGNLRCYIFVDTLKRTLLFNKLRLKHVMNITDVGHLTSDADTGEDKMEKGAKRENKTVWQIAESYTVAFKDDIHKLNIIDPDIWCKATDHIKQQIDWIKKLEKAGYTYAVQDDGLYFDTSKFKDYGKLARLRKEGLKAGARIDLGGKKHKTDFALWKFSPKDEKRQMEWPSPWGVGFPGWHIECSAMATKYLGEQFDIHCGGIDHIPVHHTNEIAQTEAITHKHWVNFWMHCEFLKFGAGKMAKSGESFITLKTLTDKGYDPLDYRYFCLNTHYRVPITFSYDALDGARSAYSSLRQKVIELKEISEDGSVTSADAIVAAQKYDRSFSEAVNDDLNIPKALGILWTMVKDKDIVTKDKLNLILKFDEVLGLDLKKAEKGTIDLDVESLIAQREKARKSKNFKLADEIRDKLAKQGIILEDSSDGVRWRKNR